MLPPAAFPPAQKATVFDTVDECVEGTLRSSYERRGVCFGGFRPTKHVVERRLRAVPHFGVQARASALGGSTLLGSGLDLERRVGSLH